MRILILLAILSAGCIDAMMPNQVSTTPRIEWRPEITSDYIILNEDLGRRGGTFHDWLAESRKKFKDPFFIIAHGAYWPPETLEKMSVDHREWVMAEWMIYPDKTFHSRPFDIKPLARVLRDLMPDRDIILISCNEHGHVLDLARVHHAMRKVYTAPQDVVPAPNSEPPGDAVRSIFDFVSGVK